MICSKNSTTLYVADFGNFTLGKDCSYFTLEIAYKHQLDSMVRIHIDSDSDVDKSVENLKIIYKDFESFIEKARHHAATDYGITYDVALERLILYSLSIQDNGGYMIDFLDKSRPPGEIDTLIAIFGNVKTGHGEIPAYHF